MILSPKQTKIPTPAPAPANKKGITLVESIISVALLMISVTGLMALATSGVRTAADARHELIATNLAMEGLEVIHNMRDNVSAVDASPTRTGWVTGIFDKCNSANGGCTVDARKNSQSTGEVWNPSEALTTCYTSCLAGGGSRMYFDPSSGLYQQASVPPGGVWRPAPYSRIVTMAAVGPVDGFGRPTRQTRVISTVTYVGYGGKTRTVTVSQDLYNWFPQL